MGNKATITKNIQANQVNRISKFITNHKILGGYRDQHRQISAFVEVMVRKPDPSILKLFALYYYMSSVFNWRWQGSYEPVVLEKQFVLSRFVPTTVSRSS